MRNWAYVCAAAALVVAGCGGGGGHNGSGTSGTGTNGTAGNPNAVPVVRLTNTSGAVPSGLLYTVYLTGQGRAADDLRIGFSRTTLINTQGNQESYAYASPAELILKQIGTPTQKTVTIGASSSEPNSRLFEQFVLGPSYVLDPTQDINPFYNSRQVPNITTTGLDDLGAVRNQAQSPDLVPARIRVFPGRDTYVPVYVNETMYTPTYDTYTTTGNFGNEITYNFLSGATFSGTQFSALNLLPSTTDPSDTSPKIRSVLADYVAFDLSSLPANGVTPPSLVAGSDGGAEVAKTLFISGDGYALSNVYPTSSGSSARFQTLTTDPTAPFEGNVAGPSASQGSQYPGFPGTYSVTLVNSEAPDPTTGGRVVSLLGRWRPATTISLSGGRTVDGVLGLSSGNFDVIMFPNSDERYDAAHPGDMLAIVHSGNTITNVYFGFANLVERSFRLYPIANLVSGDVSGVLQGTLGGYAGTSGATTDEPSVRSGTYTFTGGTLPSGFQNNGTFIVFRP